MDVYIPIANNQTVDPKILDALSESPLIKNTWIHPTKEFYPRRDYRRYHAIAKNSLEIFKQAIKIGDEFFLMCNSNKMLLYIKEIGRLLAYMETHRRCGLVAFNPHKTRTNPIHVAIGFSLIRTEAAKSVKFDMTNHKRCQCLIVVQEMRATGWDVSYTGNKIRNRKGSRKDFP